MTTASCRRAILGGALALLLSTVAGCGGAASPPDPGGSRSRSSWPPGTASPVTKVLVFVVENHSSDQMRSQMPFVVRLGERYGYATDYRAVTHPSLPNYLAMTGGSTYGVTDDDPPADHPIRGPSVFGQALAAGKTARVYAEAMPTACAGQDAGRYAVRHNPWVYHVSERGSCARFDIPLPSLADDVRAGRLPNAGLVVPDLCHDAHDCDLGQADAWLEEQVGLAMAGPDWSSGRLLVVVTADEDDRDHANLVLTALAHPALDGAVVADPLTHYSLARLYSEVLGAEPLRRAAGAPSLLEAFDLTTPSR